MKKAGIWIILFVNERRNPLSIGANSFSGKRMEEPIQLKRFAARHLSPERIFILGFAAYILLGTLLLWQPFSAAGKALTFVDALFSSASAVCVTGLAVIDIGKDLSLAGQIITIFLFQVGGLGILTFSTVFFVLMGRGISFRGRDIVQSTFLHTPRADFVIILKAILWSTLFFEGAGVLLLWYRFSWDAPPFQAFFQGLYHAVSAFNNCGYSLFSDSLVRYRGDFIVNLTVMALIVAGGLGFIVQYEVFSKMRGGRFRLSLHSKLVLRATAVLILLGAILFYLFERDHIFKELPIQDQILASLFQSITPRTAGFNTLEIALLNNETILLLLILMFIGGSPGSVAGGIKTTSATLLFLLMWSRLRGNEEVNVFRRTIPRELISRTIAIIFASAFSVSFITSLLLWFAGGGGSSAENRHFFVEYLFEAVSAFGTVGLSMGVTGKLNDFQKLALVLLMFAGRVGPLTLAFSFSRQALKKSLAYAEEGVMVG
jgi:trk system potassium uptake protein TrkH